MTILRKIMNLRFYFYDSCKYMLEKLFFTIYRMSQMSNNRCNISVYIFNIYKWNKYM